MSLTNIESRYLANFWIGQKYISFHRFLNEDWRTLQGLYKSCKIYGYTDAIKCTTSCKILVYHDPNSYHTKMKWKKTKWKTYCTLDEMTMEEEQRKLSPSAKDM